MDEVDNAVDLQYTVCGVCEMCMFAFPCNANFPLLAWLDCEAQRRPLQFLSRLDEYVLCDVTLSQDSHEQLQHQHEQALDERRVADEGREKMEQSLREHTEKLGHAETELEELKCESCIGVAYFLSHNIQTLKYFA